jgi:hypothetical protein
LSGSDTSSYGQNAYFYDAAEGLLTASILLVSEFCPKGTRHIITVFKIIQLVYKIVVSRKFALRITYHHARFRYNAPYKYIARSLNFTNLL